MQDQLSELSRKYREEMLRMYGGRKSVPSAASVPEPDFSTPPAEEVENAPSIPAPLPLPMPQTLEEPPIEPENNPDFTGQDGDYQNMMETPTDYEEPEIPDYIKNGTPPQMAQDAANELLDFEDEGELRVAALTGDGAFPVPGAHVTITVRRNGSERLAYLLLTDESGETPTVSLPAPSAALSQQPGNAQPFTVVDIRVFANGYFRAQMLNVPIFAGVTSLQSFRLIPLPLIMHEDQEILIAETEAPDL